MNVFAFSTPAHPDWRWRIVDHDGGVLEESYESFPTIAAALAEGALRLRARDDRDVASVAPRIRRTTNYVRAR
jgi:hypothetical protein